ncbi:MAG: G-D-S-L family lipolytic protein, partial [Flavobacterium sp.]
IGTTQAGAPSPFNVIGVSNPMQDSTTLTADETLQVKTATTAYNVAIRALATAKNLAFVDANAVLAHVADPLLPDPDGRYAKLLNNSGYTVNATYVTGGAFSLDGVHPSPRGYALITNVFLDAINTRYGSNFKGVKFSDYRIMFPPVL